MKLLKNGNHKESLKMNKSFISTHLNKLKSDITSYKTSHKLEHLDKIQCRHFAKYSRKYIKKKISESKQETKYIGEKCIKKSNLMAFS